jgi:hypothetical protein
MKSAKWSGLAVLLLAACGGSEGVTSDQADGEEANLSASGNQLAQVLRFLHKAEGRFSGTATNTVAGTSQTAELTLRSYEVNDDLLQYDYLVTPPGSTASTHFQEEFRFRNNGLFFFGPESGAGDVPVTVTHISANSISYELTVPNALGQGLTATVVGKVDLKGNKFVGDFTYVQNSHVIAKSSMNLER